MRLRLPVALAAAVFALRALAMSQEPEQAQYLVELDAVVVDDDGRPVPGLKQEEFQVREDGRPVELKTFDAVADIAGGRPPQRSIVLVLDDSGPGTGNTLPIQTIARMFIARMAAPDEFSVVRLSSRRDEAFGDRLEALLRISEYRSDALPFFGRETVENALRGIAKVSRTLEPIEHRRKAMVCIGLSAICNVAQPSSGRGSLLWRYWVDAVTAAARANASVYSLMPNGLSSRNEVARDSLADVTGGEGFRNTNDISRIIDIVRRDTGTYYLLGYWGTSAPKELHNLDVKVNKRGLHVRARRLRGLQTS